MGRLVQAAIDGGYLFNPAAALLVLHIEYFIRGPVEMIREVGYLLINSVEGVACYPPRLEISTSTSPEQWGQVTFTSELPRSFTWR